MITQQSPNERVGSHRRSAKTEGVKHDRNEQSRAVMLKYSDKISSHMNNSKEISRDINIDSLAGSTMVNTSNGTVSVDSVDSVDSVGNHPLSREDQDDLLEASGNCIVNRNFQWPWLTTPFPDTLLPPVSHHVSMLKLDPFRIYDRETGEQIGLSHSTGPSQVDTALPGVDTVQYSGTQSQSDFESINLSTRESTPTTVYKVPVTVSSPLISDNKDKLKHSECDSKDKLKHYECDSKDGQISVRNIVCTVMFISVCLFLLSVLSSLSSLRRETNRERMGDIGREWAHMTQEKGIGHNNTVIHMSFKSGISGPLPTGKTKRGFSTVTSTTTATDDATTTSSTTDATTTSSSTDATTTSSTKDTTTTSASTDATPTSFTMDTIANTATTATTNAPTPMLNTSPTPTAITNDANLLPPIPTPITRIYSHVTTSTTIPTTRTRRTGTTRKWYRWGD